MKGSAGKSHGSEVSTDWSCFSHFPSVICFDLDYTLWPLWVDTHVQGPPFSSGKDGHSVVDRHNSTVRLYRDIPRILNQLKHEHPDVKLAVASRTQEPEWAMEVMRLLRVPTEGYTKEQPMPLYSYFDVFEVYPSDKQAHFKSIAKKTGLPLHSMLFFDDEKRNIVSVGKLGVTCYHVAQTGVTLDNFRAGLKEFAQSRKSSSNMTSWLKAGAAK